MTSGLPTILFVADAVTLAHVARPCALARRIDPTKFSVVLACDPRYQGFLRSLDFPILPLPSLASERFLQAAAKGRPLYDTQTLRGYVRDDLALLESVRPAAVVGDHRLSLSVSARVAGVPYLSIINAYWSPYTIERLLPLPELPINRWIGAGLAQSLFKLAWPFASAWHSMPLNRVRRDHGLPGLGWDWFRAYTDADYTLYADARELVPTTDLPASHAYLGPILWSPDVPLPAWWNDLPADRPVIYATMGSSGDPALLELVLAALAGLPVTVVATTAGHSRGFSAPANSRLVELRARRSTGCPGRPDDLQWWQPDCLSVLDRRKAIARNRIAHGPASQHDLRSESRGRQNVAQRGVDRDNTAPDGRTTARRPGDAATCPEPVACACGVRSGAAPEPNSRKGHPA